MQLQNTKLKSLIDLGLHSNQAKVYLTFVKSGMSRVRTISKAPRNARDDIYIVILFLERLGLLIGAWLGELDFRDMDACLPFTYLILTPPHT